MTNAIESWSWEGCDGNAAKIEVYTRADHVKLYINGKCIGTKKPKNDCKVFFDTTYQNGEIKAVAYDANDNIIAERTLTTAGFDLLPAVLSDHFRLYSAFSHSKDRCLHSRG